MREIVISIPDEFINHYEIDKFTGSLQRIKIDIEDAIYEGHPMSGIYEVDLLDMLLIGFKDSIMKGCDEFTDKSIQESATRLKHYLECFRKKTGRTPIEECNEDLCEGCTLNYAQGTAGEHLKDIELAIRLLNMVRGHYKCSDTGKWVHEILPLPLSDGSKECVRCSKCGLHYDNATNYCPNCGSRMERGD